MTVWYEIPNFPGYRISVLGEVLDLKREPPRALEATVDPQTGYAQVCLERQGQPHACRVHSLVAQVFLGPPPAGATVVHTNGNRADNRAGNLRYENPVHHEAARTHCDAGHEWTPDNTMWRWGKGGKAGGVKYRKCRRCHADYMARYRAKRKATPTGDRGEGG